MSLWRVEWNNITAGLVVEEDVVVHAAPVLRFLKGRPFGTPDGVREWLESRGARVKETPISKKLRA